MSWIFLMNQQSEIPHFLVFERCRKKLKDLLTIYWYIIIYISKSDLPELFWYLVCVTVFSENSYNLKFKENKHLT